MIPRFSAFDFFSDSGFDTESELRSLETEARTIEILAFQSLQEAESTEGIIQRYFDASGIEHIRVYQEAPESDALWEALSEREDGVPLELLDTTDA